jgi:hypothetical protein
MSSSHGDNLKKPAKNKHDYCRSQKQARGAAELAAVSPEIRLLLVAKQGADVWHLLVRPHQGFGSARENNCKTQCQA